MGVPAADETVETVDGFLLDLSEDTLPLPVALFPGVQQNAPVVHQLVETVLQVLVPRVTLEVQFGHHETVGLALLLQQQLDLDLL